MQFAKVQGGGLIAVGILLLALQVYIFFASTQQPGSPTQAPAVSTRAEQAAKFVPGIVGVLTFAAGAYFIISQRNKTNDEEIAPERTKSGLPR